MISSFSTGSGDRWLISPHSTFSDWPYALTNSRQGRCRGPFLFRAPPLCMNRVDTSLLSACWHVFTVTFTKLIMKITFPVLFFTNEASYFMFLYGQWGLLTDLAVNLLPASQLTFSCSSLVHPRLHIILGVAKIGYAVFKDFTHTSRRGHFSAG